jgi:TRAP-type mannitol/chloroaromatic compound transport system substrate-binding protein
MLHVLVNEKKFAELPKHYQVALTTACGEASTWMPAKYDAQNPDAMRRLVAGGTKLRRFPNAVLEAAEKAAYEVYEDMNSKSAHWKRIYPGWKKFRDEQIQWFRVAESTYDNYMMNSKVGQPAEKTAAAKKS